MNEATRTRELVGILRKNRAILRSIYDTCERALKEEISTIGRTSTSALIPAGLLENYYTCLETMVLRISQHFENSLLPERWHADLLEKMTIRIEGTRIELIDQEAHSRLVELLKFRHFRRYYFEMEYDWDRIDFLITVLRKAHPAVLAGIDRFLEFLGSLA